MVLNLTNPIFHNEDEAREHFEKIRWPDGPICPHCGGIKGATKLAGKSTRPGLYKCKQCQKPFTATIGTLYERSHVPLHKWLLATHLMCSSKKGMSAHQLWRMLGFGSYRTAWFMAHRIREGMRKAKVPGSMGGEGKLVEADETYVGGKAKNRAFKDPPPKEAVMALVERKGQVQSFHLRVANVTAETVKPIIAEVLSTDSHFRTDESGIYWKIGETFATDRTVNHAAEEYVRGDAHTNTVEGYFSHPEARDLWRLSSRQPGAPEAVSVRIRLPLQPPHSARRRRLDAGNSRHQRRCRQAAHLSTAYWGGPRINPKGGSQNEP